MINPDVFFKVLPDTSKMGFIAVFIINHINIIQGLTAGFCYLIMFIWFWNFTRDWKINNEA